MKVKYASLLSPLHGDGPIRSSVEWRETLERKEAFRRLITIKDEDQVIWSLVDSGVFTAKSAWESVRNSSHPNQMLATVWAMPSPLQTRMVIW